MRCPEDVTCSAQYASLGPLALRTILGLSHGGQERGGSNNPQVAYTRGKDLSGSLEGAGGLGGLLARSTWGGSSWSSHALYHADGNGNVMKLIDSASEASVAAYRYDPFGNTLSSSGTLADANVYRFSSKEFHIESGMYYYLYRFYDPTSQRWLNRDPLADNASGRPTQTHLDLRRMPWDDPNLYEALSNDPIGRCDAYGEAVAWPVALEWPLGTILFVCSAVVSGVIAHDLIKKEREKKERERKECQRQCHANWDATGDTFELQYCLQRCNGGWFGPSPPRPRPGGR